MKEYIVNIGNSEFTIKAENLKMAKAVANMHKRHEHLKGQTTVRLKKGD